MSGRNDLDILRPAPADPFSAPEVDILNLKPFSPDAPDLHRRRSNGPVILSRPGNFFHLQPGERAIRISTHQTEPPLNVGNPDEASGFVEIPQYCGELREAVYRNIATNPRPPPHPNLV